jgi:hypothetical protein
MRRSLITWGYEKHDPAGQGQGSGDVRNGSRPKTVLTDSTGGEDRRAAGPGRDVRAADREEAAAAAEWRG